MLNWRKNLPSRWRKTRSTTSKGHLYHFISYFFSAGNDNMFMEIIWAFVLHSAEWEKEDYDCTCIATLIVFLPSSLQDSQC